MRSHLMSVPRCLGFPLVLVLVTCHRLAGVNRMSHVGAAPAGTHPVPRDGTAAARFHG